jgi:hypothetical protein
MATEQRRPWQLQPRDRIIVQMDRYTVQSRTQSSTCSSCSVVRTTDHNGLLTTFTFSHDEFVLVVVPDPDRAARRRMAERRQHR